MNPWLLAYLISVAVYIITQIVIVVFTREKLKTMIMTASKLEGRKKKIVNTTTTTKRIISGVYITLIAAMPVLNIILTVLFLLTLDTVVETAIDKNFKNGTFKLVDCEE